jgi:hypothetical protein
VDLNRYSHLDVTKKKELANFIEFLSARFVIYQITPVIGVLIQVIILKI